jgi:hypothetical protein
MICRPSNTSRRHTHKKLFPLAILKVFFSQKQAMFLNFYNAQHKAARPTS